MDEADLAQQFEERLIILALSARKKQLQSPDDMCIWCKYEAVIPKSAFCSADCGEDYHKYQREMKQRICLDTDI